MSQKKDEEEIQMNSDSKVPTPEEVDRNSKITAIALGIAFKNKKPVTYTSGKETMDVLITSDPNEKLKQGFSIPLTAVDNPKLEMWTRDVETLSNLPVVPKRLLAAIQA